MILNSQGRGYLLYFIFIWHTIITQNIGQEERKKWRGDLKEIIGAYGSLWGQLNLLRFYSSKVNGSSIFKTENSYQAENQGFCYKLILMVSPGTYLVKNQESQFRTNESQLKKRVQN